MKISAPGGRLAVNGTVRTEGGTYVAYGQRMEIERGEVEFVSRRLEKREPNMSIR